MVSLDLGESAEMLGAYIMGEPAVGTAQPASGFEAHFLVGGCGRDAHNPLPSYLPHISSCTEPACLSSSYIMYKPCRVSDVIYGRVKAVLPFFQEAFSIKRHCVCSVIRSRCPPFSYSPISPGATTQTNLNSISDLLMFRCVDY